MNAILLSTCTRPPSDDAIVESRIDTLLAKMTLEEKIGQTSLRGMSSRHHGPLPEHLNAKARAGKIGAMLNVMVKEHAAELQRLAVNESRLGIPILYGRDVIHGFRTIFPLPLAQAASFSPEGAAQAARIAAREASTYGIRWTFAPMVDIARDARWGRIAESFGEDPYLASRFAEAVVRGFQGDALSQPTSLAACAKHFAGYGAAEGGRDYNTTWIPEPLLRNIYLPPFHAAVDAGAASLMSGFNDLNGTPATANRFLLTDVLRREWQFDGFVVSDWASVTETIQHGYATDAAHAAERALHAGLDMEMVSSAYEDNLAALINGGRVREADLDEAVRRILRIKLRLGLFERPTFDANTVPLLEESSLRAARQLAIDSFVLLKNEGSVLPVAADATVAVIGPLADAPHEQLGTWTFDGQKSDSRTPLAALRQRLGKRVRYAAGLRTSRTGSREGFAAALAAAREADVVLLFGGEEAILSGEAHSRASIDLPGAQEALIHELATSSKPIVLVVMAGRPITLDKVLDDLAAVLVAWHPGTMAGPALADVLLGDAAPSGKLPVSWPKTVGQVPIHYNHENTGRPARAESFVHIDKIPVEAPQSSLGNESHYLDAGYEPRFPFGHGLTYTRFGHSDLRLSRDHLDIGETVEISATVRNAGARRGTQVVQLYVRDLVGSLTRPVRELKGFQRIDLAPGDQERVRFTLHTDDLAFYDASGRRVVETGRFRVWIAPDAASGLAGEFEVRP